MITSYVQDKRQPITTNADFEGNLIGAALFWNPTAPLRNDDGTLGRDKMELLTILNRHLVKPASSSKFYKY